MSIEIPKRKVGDKVRVNENSSTLKRNIANQYGTVTCLAIAPTRFEDDLYEVLFENGKQTLVEGSVLFADGRK